MKRALVLGGTGAVGSAVLARLRERDVRAVFTYHRSRERAEALAQELGHRAASVDATDAEALAAFVAGLFAGEEAPDVAIHCIGWLDRSALVELSDADWERSYAVNVRSALIAVRELARGMLERGGGDIVLVGALDRTQSLPIPTAFAACQGMLASLTMAVAKELGGRGIRINMVALGLLDRGLSDGLSARIREDYLGFSALRRLGTPAEVARSIVWLALDNSYMNGKVLAENGGI